MEEKSK